MKFVHALVVCSFFVACGRAAAEDHDSGKEGKNISIRLDLMQGRGPEYGFRLRAFGWEMEDRGIPDQSDLSMAKLFCITRSSTTKIVLGVGGAYVFGSKCSYGVVLGEVEYEKGRFEGLLQLGKYIPLERAGNPVFFSDESYLLARNNPNVAVGLAATWWHERGEGNVSGEAGFMARLRFGSSEKYEIAARALPFGGKETSFRVRLGYRF